MTEHEVNKLDNFICGWYFDDTSICSRIIDYFNRSETTEGKMGEGTINKQWKDSMDCVLEDEVLIDEYYNNLMQAVVRYKSKYIYCDKYAPWGIVEGINIQHYKPGGGFHKWHTERANSTHPYSTRHLVFMTYLNTVTDCGETEFFYQKVKIQPEKGLTIIWPADWTFTHRGVLSPTQEKYIVTGWFNYVDKRS